ncbi:hypothetical protein EV356DRAFT_510189 [Viridothelium virens]|uniref:Uncharacterized protein n=1 Tax=Viridothelium virens TaxID=1048519 RepID=A0A6A6GVV8_VIRVR|nr:hypothetical protein EV356DRAFT_510189 [Viridothelium virens]
MATQRERRWWTSQEDDILKNGVRIQLREDGTVQNWNDIAASLPDRTNKDCRKRWSKIQLDIRKGAWTREEDERLKQAVEQLGFKWCQVATMVQTRNADQCAKRWQHVLGPDFKHSPWTPEEDRKLLDAITKYGNNWKQIGLSDLPDRSTHDIRNRSLLLGRRSRKTLPRRPVPAQQPSPPFDDDDMVNGGPQGSDGEEDDGDEDACDENSECEYTGSSELHQAQESSRGIMTQQEISIPSELRIDPVCIPHFQQPHTSSATHLTTNSVFEPHWSGTTRQDQTYVGLSTPCSGSTAWFNALESTTSDAAASQTPWLAKSATDEQCFQNPALLDVGYFDIPGSKDGSSNHVGIENNASASVYAHGETRKEIKQKGSVTLTLSQVDPCIAHEIMGSVLKHSAGLKIQCIVNDN